MEVHVGSIDEEEDEQGITHMIEHVAFLGSKKREKLLGTRLCFIPCHCYILDVLNIYYRTVFDRNKYLY